MPDQGIYSRRLLAHVSVAFAQYGWISSENARPPVWGQYAQLVGSGRPTALSAERGRMPNAGQRETYAAIARALGVDVPLVRRDLAQLKCIP